MLGRPARRPHPPDLERLIDQTQALTPAPSASTSSSPRHLENTDPACFALAARRARLVEFFWGWPDPALVETVHAEGALVSWQVGSKAEAVAAAAAGVDLIVAQGVGAGGHVRGTIGVLALLDEVLGAVEVPVLAAGGIGTGRALAAVLAAGADGARMGTRFVAAAEADAHPRYVEALIAAAARGHRLRPYLRLRVGRPGAGAALVRGRGRGLRGRGGGRGAEPGRDARGPPSLRAGRDHPGGDRRRSRRCRCGPGSRWAG